MAALRVFPFIGALVAIGAVVLGIIGISTTYWLSTGPIHSGNRKIAYEYSKKTNKFFFFSTGLWQNCLSTGCIRTEGGRSAAMALAVC